TAEDEGSGRALDARRRPLAAIGTRSCARVASRADRRGARGQRRRVARARRRGAVVSAAHRAQCVNVPRRSELPPLLRAIHDPPKRLYLRGAAEAELLSRLAVAIVGARACSPYGQQIARMLGRELAAEGVVVVSGLARGIDGHAHRGALETDGHTVAVLGCGIDLD